MTFPIQLQVTGDRNDSWKLTWQDPQWRERHYHVSARVLKKMAQSVRDALQQVVGDARTQTPLGPSLKKLAAAGADLRKAIFLANDSRENDAIYIRDQHLPSRNDWSLLISLDQHIYIPWGLAYDGDPDALPDNPPAITPDVYAAFWALKYRVCTLHGIIDAAGIHRPRDNSEVRMLTIINQSCWDAAQNQIPAAERQLFESTLANSEQPISSSVDFFRTWKTVHKDVDLLYLYCHANQTSLALSGQDEINSTQFFMNVRHDPPQDHPVCLVFLNGCQTAIGAPDKALDEGFMEATGTRGFCGFIGTEAKIPDLFAMRFAADFFFHLLYEEMTVGEIMDKLRRDHWPLGLVYSTCCHPLFKIKRATSAPVARPARNLCDEPLTAAMLL